METQAGFSFSSSARASSFRFTPSAFSSFASVRSAWVSSRSPSLLFLSAFFCSFYVISTAFVGCGSTRFLSFGMSSPILSISAFFVCTSRGPCTIVG